MIDQKIARPPMCYDESCEIVYSTYSDENYRRGFSFFYYGKLAKPHVFKEKETEHVNELCHCYYTPLKGMIRFFITIGDLWGEANAKCFVMNRLQDLKCGVCGSPGVKKVINNECLVCKEKGKP